MSRRSRRRNPKRQRASEWMLNPKSMRIKIAVESIDEMFPDLSDATWYQRVCQFSGPDVTYDDVADWMVANCPKG